MIVSLPPRDPDLRRALALQRKFQKLQFLRTSSQVVGKVASGGPGGTGGGSVNGSGTDNHIARFDGTGNIQDSGWVIADTTDEMSKDTGTTKFIMNPATPLLTIQDQDGGGSLVIVLGEYSDTQSRFELSSAGSMAWGPGGGTARDTTLSRLAANLLGLSAGDALVIGATAGNHASTTEGTISYNSTTDQLEVYANGAWNPFPDKGRAVCMIPLLPKIDNTTVADSTSDRATFAYLGRAWKSVASGATIKVQIRLTRVYQTGGPTPWAEVGIMRGTPTCAANATLDPVGVIDVSTAWAAPTLPGNVTLSITTSAAIVKGDDLWLAVGSKTNVVGGTYEVRGVVADELGGGLSQRLSTSGALSAYSATAVNVTTASNVPWAELWL